MPNRPYFDGIEMKGGGDAVSAARAVLQTGEYDFAWNLQVEDEILRGWRRAGRATSHLARRRHRAHPAQHHRSVDRGRRRAREPQDQASDACRIRWYARRWPAGRQASVEKYIYGRTGQATANFINNPERFRSKSTRYEFNSTRRTPCSTRPAGRRVPTASARRTARS